jgi:hypothetical protein
MVAVNKVQKRSSMFKVGAKAERRPRERSMAQRLRDRRIPGTTSSALCGIAMAFALSGCAAYEAQLRGAGQYAARIVGSIARLFPSSPMAPVRRLIPPLAAPKQSLDLLLDCLAATTCADALRDSLVHERRITP